MFLKQVTINGFKSFADKTTMTLPKGITCIVGPNGCGKSNIVDAIRWVLGEQSAKALRGGKMQDVIFQGTDKRKPLQFCDVALLFSDCEEQLKIGFNEVEISRKVTRDGGSDYWINGKAARLKDIQQLFMDTGIGRVSYSFMVQGQIDQILSSNPGERRSIFEEASGITRYKTQRKEALNKLILVDQNLARVTDRITEIDRQIGTLRKQASKTLRYKRRSYRLRHLDLALNAKNYSEQNQEIIKDEAECNKLGAGLFEVEKLLSEKSEELMRLRGQRAAIGESLESQRRAAEELRSSKDQAQMNSEFALVRKQDLINRDTQIENELKSLSEQLEMLSGRVNKDQEVKQMQFDLVSNSDEVLKEHNLVLAELEESLRNAEADLSRFKQDLLISEGSVTRLRSKCTTLEVDLKSYQVNHANTADNVFQIKEESAVLERKIEEALSALNMSQERVASIESEIYEANELVNTLRATYRDQQSKILNMDRVFTAKSARLTILNDFQARMEGFSEGVKAILKGKISEFISADTAKVVSQNLEVDASWTFAFEAMMGSALDAVAFENADKIGGALQSIKAQELGKACLQITKKTKAYEFSGAMPSGTHKASDCVRASSNASEALKPFIDGLLEGCYFCANIEDFINFTRQNEDFAFAYCASADGDVFDSRGFLYVAGSEKSNTENSFLLRSQEIKRLKEELEADNNTLTEMNEEAMRINSRMNDAEADVENKKALLSEVKREISSINAHVQAMKNNLSEKISEGERKSAQLKEMENSRFEAQDRLNEAVKELQDAEKVIAEGKSGIDSREALLAELRAQKEQKFSVLSEVRLDFADKKARLESLERGLGATIEQQQETRNVIEKRRQEKSEIAQSIAKLESDSLQEGNNSKIFADKLDEALKQISSSKEVLTICEEKLAEAEETISLERQKHSTQINMRNEIEVRLATLKSRRDGVVERIRSEYDCDISSVDWKMELWKSDEEFEIKVKLDDIEDGEVQAKAKKNRGEPTEADFASMDSTDFSIVENEVRELRESISAMGAVNLVAIDEYAELKERFDFLKTQSDDLWASKNELVAAIDEINATSQKMFADTFEQIRKNFEFTFKKVFGGGSADLKLVENEDVLDSGIEIIARPPSTVLKSLSLLSGGQRTMTAVALLFAIYMVKPSPFCVLDELDAPLDDANIGRYTDLLKEFTRYSQFLVVSHNKRTVSAANTIYGVTQPERGVTKLISMRFNPASGETEQDTSQAESA